MYVCMYVFMFMYACMHACMHVAACMCVCTKMYISRYLEPLIALIIVANGRLHHLKASGVPFRIPSSSMLGVQAHGLVVRVQARNPTPQAVKL